MGWRLTVPELFVRRVHTQVAEAALQEVLDPILGARPVLHLLLQRPHTNRRSTNRKSQNKNKNHTPELRETDIH